MNSYISYKEAEIGKFIDETKNLIDAYLQKYLSPNSKKLLLTCKALILEFEKEIILPFDKGNILPTKHPFRQSISDIGEKLEKIIQKLPRFDDLSEDLDPLIFEIRLKLEPLFEAKDYQAFVGKFFNLNMIKNIASWLSWFPGSPSSVEEELNKKINIGYYRFQNELFEWLDIKVMAYVKKQILVEINEKASFETLGDVGIRRLRKLYSEEYPEFCGVLDIYDLLMKYKKNPYHAWHNMRCLAVNDFLTPQDIKILRKFIESLFKRLNIPLQKEQERTDITQEIPLPEEPKPELPDAFSCQNPDEEENPPENDEGVFEDLSEEMRIEEEPQIYEAAHEEEPSNAVKLKIDPIIWLNIIIELNACLMEKSFFLKIKEFITASAQTNRQEYLNTLNSMDLNKLEDSQRLKINKKLEEWIEACQEMPLRTILKRAYVVFNPDSFPVLKNTQILTSSAKALQMSIEELNKIEGLHEDEVMVCQKLSEALKSKLWLFLNTPTQIHQFEKEFKILLRSQEDKMANHLGWRRVVSNLLSELAAFCFAMLARMTCQPYTGRQITLFADKAQRCLHAIEEEVEQFCCQSV